MAVARTMQNLHTAYVSAEAGYIEAVHRVKQLQAGREGRLRELGDIRERLGRRRGMITSHQEKLEQEQSVSATDPELAPLYVSSIPDHVRILEQLKSMVDNLSQREAALLALESQLQECLSAAEAAKQRLETQLTMQL